MAEPAYVTAACQCIRDTVAVFGADRVALSFNGGKDSTVLLHLLRQALPDTFRQIHYVYFDQPDEFPEVKDFIADCQARYQLNVEYVAANYKAALDRVVNQNGIKAIFLGTRLGDPRAEQLSTFEMSDPGWPRFMRVQPILHWTYGQVWLYLQDKPFCRLYDMGYTSLGAVGDTRPNPALRRPDGTYAPASALSDGALERAGRGSTTGAPPSLLGTSCNVWLASALLIGLLAGGLGYRRSLGWA